MKLQELCSFIPYFENADPEKVCQWHTGEGVFPHPTYSDEFMKFINAFYKCKELAYDYAAELDRLLPDWRTADIIKVVETANFELLKVILTKAVRVERFCDGAWENAIKSGLFLAILRRLYRMEMVQ